jgi:hypothetical protein
MATYFILGSLLIAMLPRTLAHSHPAQLVPPAKAAVVTPVTADAPQQGTAATSTTKAMVAPLIADASRQGTITVSTNAANIAPMIVDPPLQGVVTIVEPRGMFYINIGQREQLNNGAQLLILRDADVIGEARVVKADLLDSLAVVKANGRTLSLLAGDQVMVKNNPYVAPNPRCLPWVQPDMSQTEGELMLTLLTILATGATIAHSN